MRTIAITLAMCLLAAIARAGDTGRNPELKPVLEIQLLAIKSQVLTMRDIGPLLDLTEREKNALKGGIAKWLATCDDYCKQFDHGGAVSQQACDEMSKTQVIYLCLPTDPVFQHARLVLAASFSSPQYEVRLEQARYEVYAQENYWPPKDAVVAPAAAAIAKDLAELWPQLSAKPGTDHAAVDAKLKAKLPEWLKMIAATVPDPKAAVRLRITTEGMIKPLIHHMDGRH